MVRLNGHQAEYQANTAVIRRREQSNMTHPRTWASSMTTLSMYAVRLSILTATGSHIPARYTFQHYIILSLRSHVVSPFVYSAPIQNGRCGAARRGHAKDFVEHDPFAPCTTRKKAMLCLVVAAKPPTYKYPPSPPLPTLYACQPDTQPHLQSDIQPHIIRSDAQHSTPINMPDPHDEAPPSYSLLDPALSGAALTHAILQ